MKSHSLRGLTLIELAIALAIAAILGALAVPSFGSLLQRKRLDAAAHALAADLGEARQEALRSGHTVAVVFGRRDGGWCWLVVADLSPVADCAARDGGAGTGLLKRVDSADHPGIALLDTQAMRFDPSGATAALGTPSAAFGNARGERLRVRVSRLGHAAVCAPTRAASDAPHC